MTTMMQSRAAQQLPELLGEPDFKFGQMLEPILVSARSLSGSAPIFWSSALRDVALLEIPVALDGPGQIVFRDTGGALILDLSGVQGYAFYVEVRAAIGDPAARLHWDATMAADPVFGLATPVPGTDLHFFATPFSERPDVSHIQISKDAGSPQESDPRWSLLEVELLGFMRG
ncbi:hypothetical protein [Novosphingobium sp.]|uniref:hypothetical protein n=1 Tax=Novosphingobium sp. TaxID=1874826 RepID=UPI00273658EA|nr:hypothetical protein [Novosphingobium sp.]MDP3908292.1 hypothetical protein [Novosphingobium sp.]